MPSDFRTLINRQVLARKVGAVSMKKFYIDDYINKRYGHLTVIGQSQNSESGHSFDFVCDCGNVVSFPPYRVFTTGQKSCGKCHYAYSPKIRFDPSNYIGKHNNRLTVIGVSRKDPNSNSYCLTCLCECGNIAKASPYQFKTGSVKSCGCLRKKSPNFQDGRSNNELYGIWFQMVSRCENPKNHKYKDYGGRGISVCEDWHDFWKFASWSDAIGGCPKGFSLDRIDVNGNYEPTNCRWADSRLQSLNKRSNRIITFNGISKPLHEWALSLNISDQALAKRIDKGWKLEKALTLSPKNKP